MRRPTRSAALAALAAMAMAIGLSCGKGPESPAAASPGAGATPAPAAPPVEAADVETRTARPAGGRAPVIWLGLDGLDWELLDRLAGEGKMPHWKQLTSEGYSARLTSFMPVLSPIVWTSLATGSAPDVHRVLDFQEVDARTGQKVPISGHSRSVPAVWNAASAEGLKVGVVGWWATHPAEEVNGFFVTDHASPILFEGLSRQGVAYPASLGPGVEQVVSRYGRVPSVELERFLPTMSGVQIESERAGARGLQNPYVALASIVAATRVQQSIARDLYDRNHPDLMVLYLEGPDGIGHVFASFVPPKMSCVSAEDFERFHGVVDEYYGMVDQLLGQWMRRAREDGATLVVNSDHGFKWSEDRPCERSSLNPSTAAYWHRLDGVFAAWGARVRRGKGRGTASVFDVAPTIAALAGTSIDRSASGHALREAFDGLAEPPRKDLQATVAVRRVAAEELSEQEISEHARRLRALGYLSGSEAERLAPTGGDRPGLTEGGWNNLGVYLRENGKDLSGAEAAFRKAMALRPTYHSPQFNLAVLYRQKGEDRKAVDWLFRSLDAGHADPEGTAVRWFLEYRDKGKGGPAVDVLERASAKYPANEGIARELALIRFKAKDCEGARKTLTRFEAATRDADTVNALALFETCLGRRDAALALFDRSLTLKPDQPAVVHSMNLLRKAPAGAP